MTTHLKILSYALISSKSFPYQRMTLILNLMSHGWTTTLFWIASLLKLVQFRQLQGFSLVFHLWNHKLFLKLRSMVSVCSVSRQERGSQSSMTIQPYTRNRCWLVEWIRVMDVVNHKTMDSTYFIVNYTNVNLQRKIRPCASTKSTTKDSTKKTILKNPLYCNKLLALLYPN